MTTVSEALIQWLLTAETCSCNREDKEQFICRDLKCLKENKNKTKTYCATCLINNFQNHPHEPVPMYKVMSEADIACSLRKEEIKTILNEFNDVHKNYSALKPLLKYFHE